MNLQFIIFLVGDGLAPVVRAAYAGDLDRDMGKPTVLFRAVPVLYSRGDSHDIAGLEALRRFALFLIPALAVNADEELSAAALRIVDMPVIAAAGLEGDIYEKHRFARVGERIEIALTDKVLRIGIVGLAQPEQPSKPCSARSGVYGSSSVAEERKYASRKA